MIYQSSDNHVLEIEAQLPYALANPLVLHHRFVVAVLYMYYEGAHVA